jgi:uncharacterized protein with PIN domain
MEQAPEMECPECGGQLTPLGSNEVWVGSPDQLAAQYDHYECPECESRYRYSHEQGRLRAVDGE